MKTFINVIRWLIVVVLIFIYFIVVNVGLPAFVIAKNFSQKETVKNILHRSDIYSQLINLAIETIAQQSLSKGHFSSVTNSLQNPNSELRKVVDENINATLLEKKCNLIIDAVYDWLGGKTNKPQFTLSLVESPEIVKQILSAAVADSIKNLPPCATGSPLPTDFSIFTASCLPNNFKQEDIIASLENPDTGVNTQEIYNKTIIKSEDIPIDEKTTRYARMTFRWLTAVPMIVFSFLIITTVLIFLLIPNLKKRFTKTGSIIMISSITLLISTLVAKYCYNPVLTLVLKRFPQLPTTSLNLTQNIVKGVYWQILDQIIIASLWLFSIGLLFIIVGIIIKLLYKKNKLNNTEK